MPKEYRPSIFACEVCANAKWSVDAGATVTKCKNFDELPFWLMPPDPSYSRANSDPEAFTFYVQCAAFERREKS